MLNREDSLMVEFSAPGEVLVRLDAFLVPSHHSEEAAFPRKSRSKEREWGGLSLGGWGWGIKKCKGRPREHPEQ